MSADPPSLVQRLTALRGGMIAILAGGCLVGFERLASFTLAGESGALPARSGLGWWGANVGIAMAVWLIAAASHAVMSRLIRASDRETRRLVATAVVSGLGIGALALPLGESLTTGGWIAQQSWGWLLRFAPAAGCFGVGVLLTALVGVSGPRSGKIMSPALVLGAAIVVAINHVVLSGTYPDVHLTLHLVAVATLVAAVAIWPWSVQSNRVRAVATASLLAAAAAPALWLTVPLGYRPQLSMSSQMASLLMEMTMPRIDLKFAEREFAQVDPAAGRYLPEPSGTRLARKDWNVLWITVDTLRWDALWPARPAKGTKFAKTADTPFLNKWLAGAVVFDRAYAQSSATHRSMPPMFKSLEANEPTLDIGTPLGSAASRTGRTSIAVVNNFFLEPRYKRSQSLLWGFDVVEIYHKQRQEELVPLLEGALRDHGDQGFFTWLHFYNMHDPGYGAEGLQSKGALAVRYRHSLRWLDAQMENVIGVLKRLGVADDTIVVFAADHGESIGANRVTNHGPTVFEEEIRVPLAFYIPGVKPRRIPQTAGNIDIVPTLWDAMGVAPEPTFRGRSLLGAIVGDADHAEVPYYIENASGEVAGAVIGSEKLIQKLKSGTTMRFDTSTDPTEDINLFADGAADRPLLAALYAKNPELVLVTPIMGSVAVQQLKATDPEQPGAALRYLLNIAARSGDDDARAAMEKLFFATPHDEVKLEVLSAVQQVDPEGASQLASDELSRRASGEARFVEGLGQIGVAAIDVEVVARRFQPKPPSDEVAIAWMHWLLRWKAPAIGPILIGFAEEVRARPTADREMLRSMAELIRTAKLSKTESTALLEFNRWLLGRDDPRVLPEAVTTAGKLKDELAAPAIHDLAQHGAIRTRQAALYALASIEGADAVDAIVAAGADPSLVLDAVKALEVTRSKRAIPFVQDVAKNHYNWIIRDNAKRALKRLKN